MRTQTSPIYLITSLLVLSSGLSIAGGPTIDIPPAEMPSESFFAANPGATVNVRVGGFVFSGELVNPFGFNGATVNIHPGGFSGFSFADQFIEDVIYNIDGGDLLRTKFVGSVGTTTLNINSGSVERGLWLLGNSTAVMSGGALGITAQGQPSMTMEDTSSFAISGGTVDDFIILSDSSSLTMTGGTIDGAILLNDDATATISAGSIGPDGRLKSIGNVLTVTGGTLGTGFVIEKGVVNMSGGSFGSNAGIINGSGVDPMFNMTGGALGSGFRAFSGTINISGGLVGDVFRLGTPTGDGSGVTLNLTVKSATLGGAPLDLSPTPTTITTRGGVFLSCTMLDDSLIGLILNESNVFLEDRIREGAILTIALTPCAADIDGSGDLNFFDVGDFLDAFAALDAVADFNSDGVWNFFDVGDFLKAYLAGCP